LPPSILKRCYLNCDSSCPMFQKGHVVSVSLEVWLPGGLAIKVGDLQ
jgi:hypothetical protein